MFSTPLTEATFRSISQQPQVQCSTTDQAHALAIVASKFGLNVASDFLKKSFPHPMTLPVDYVLNTIVVDNLAQFQQTDDTQLATALPFAHQLARKFGLYDVADFISLCDWDWQAKGIV